MANKFRSHCATIRPKNGADNKLIHQFIKYAKKQEYCLVVSEKYDAERHLHMQFWFSEPRELSVTQRAMENNQSKCDPNWDSSSKKVCRKGVTHAYNDDFMNNYLSPDKEGSEVLYKKIPEETREYYPSDEYQDKAKTISLAADKRFCKLSLEFLEWNAGEKVDLVRCAEYLSWRMFTARNMYVLTSRKAKVELAENLYWYTMGGESSSAIWSFIDDGNKKTSPLFDDGVCKICFWKGETGYIDSNCNYNGFDCLDRPFQTNCKTCYERMQKKDL